jgi:hypothetical protein
MRRLRCSCVSAAVAVIALTAGGAWAQGDQAPASESAPGEPLAAVERSENLVRTLDLNRDGFVDRAEAEAFYRQRFGTLDQDGDGRLSRAELEADLAGGPDPDVAFETMDLNVDLGVDDEEYFDAGFGRFEELADPAIGMMSTADFQDMVRLSDPLITDQLQPAPPGSGENPPPR